ncbi:MAG TPA: GNAT family N-acetyltransferase [Gaiellaceae bacterium]
MPVRLRPSSDLTHAELAELFTAAYEGYFVPFAVDEATLGYMVDVFDLDLSRSLVAEDGAERLGLANVGLRAARAWLGGVGVVAASRRRGIGELLTRRLLEKARLAGADEMVLEVIVENRPAIALYEKLGFVRTRELVVASLPAAEGDGAAAEAASVDAAQALVREHRDGEEPWQRADQTVTRLGGRGAGAEGIVAGDAAAIYRLAGETVSLIQAAGDRAGLLQILSVLRAKGTVSAVNYPAGDTVSAALRDAGADVTLRQYEMLIRL